MRSDDQFNITHKSIDSYLMSKVNSSGTVIMLTMVVKKTPAAA